MKATHHLGDRRDHFEALGDVWETFRHILKERKRREADPTLNLLRNCSEELSQAKGASHEDALAKERLGQMLEFFEVANTWGERAGAFSPKTLKRFAQMGDVIFKLAGN